MDLKIYNFHFDNTKAKILHQAINDREKFSIERDADGSKVSRKEPRKSYKAWNRLCATMTRLEDTIRYINSMELGKYGYGQSAFDFYEFINCAYVVIECIKVVVYIFDLDINIIKNIEQSTEVFGTKYGETGNDGKFFEYIRSLCGVHPLCTSYQKEYLHGSEFHCCPYVAWTDRGYVSSKRHNNADLLAHVYTTTIGDSIDIELYIIDFENYLNKWIDCIPDVIEAKNKYVDDKYEVLRKERVKDITDFGNDNIKYIEYLKEEYIRRIDVGNEYILDEYTVIFNTKFSDEDNQRKLVKYKNAIMYSLGFLHNGLQTMTFEGFQSTGIEYPDENIKTELYLELYSPFLFGGEFEDYTYEIGKLYSLSPNSCSNLYDKLYSKELLENCKDVINKYVCFTNEESDEEIYVLTKVALYLESLNRKSITNKNIPNEEKYRETLLTEGEAVELHQGELDKEIKLIDLNIFNDI